MANRIIQISWTAVTGAGLTGYNIYLVNGAPENTTKTLLAFNNGLSNVTYTYTGVEGNQYQFEVRATDGTNEGEPLEIFYPNGTTLYTPTVITPSGQPMMISRDMPYITKDEYVGYATGTGMTTSSALYTSGVLDVYIQAASEQVNRYCNRHFNTQTKDEVSQGIYIGENQPKLQTIILQEKPIQNILRVDIQILKWFINFDLQYLQVFPEEGFIQLVPFLGGNASGVPLPSAALLEGLLGKVWVRYTYGYDVIPDAVKMATALFTTKLIGMQENPVSAQSVKFGRNFSLTWDKDNDPLYRQIELLLKPYKVMQYGRP